MRPSIIRSDGRSHSPAITVLQLFGLELPQRIWRLMPPRIERCLMVIIVPLLGATRSPERPLHLQSQEQNTVYHRGVFPTPTGGLR